MSVTSEERTLSLIPVVARYIAKMKKKLKAVSKDEFLHNELLGDSICMDIIKTADKMKGISADYLKECPGFPRHKIVDMRNALAHFCWEEVTGESNELEIDCGKVWDFVHNTLFPLGEYLTSVNL